MPSGPRSGKFGVIHGNEDESTTNPITRIFNWLLNPTMAPEVRVHSGSANGTDRATGVEDWTGSFNLYSAFDPLCLPGNKFNWEGYSAPSNGVYGSNGDVYYGRPIVDSIAITWNWQPSQSLVQTVNISGDGGYATLSKFIDDATQAEPSRMCDLPPVEYSIDGGSQWLTWNNVTQATLNILTNSQPYVNSSTRCGTGRRAGAMDWNLALTEEETSVLPIKGQRFDFRLWISPTRYWQLDGGMYQNLSNINVDRQSQTIISKVVNFAMDVIVLDQLVGQIILPDADPPGGTVWFPVPAAQAPVEVITDLAVTGGLGQATLNWTSTGETGVTNEVVYRSPYPYGPFMRVASFAVAGMYTDTAVPLAGTWYYRVTSANANGESEISNVDSDVIT